MRNVLRRACHWLMKLIPGVFVTVALLDLAALALGSVVLAGGVVAGLVAVLSAVLILANTPSGVRAFAVRVLIRHGYVLDLVATLALTWLGLQIGSVTIAVCALVLGLHISAFVSLLRWANALFTPLAA